jgi:hypothetical protein
LHPPDFSSRLVISVECQREFAELLLNQEHKVYAQNNFR